MSRSSMSLGMAFSFGFIALLIGTIELSASANARSLSGGDLINHECKNLGADCDDCHNDHAGGTWKSWKCSSAEDLNACDFHLEFSCNDETCNCGTKTKYSDWNCNGSSSPGTPCLQGGCNCE